MTARPNTARGRLLVGGLIALVALAVLVALGRWERSHNADVQNARMSALYRTATSDGFDSPRLDAYRLTLTLDCLLYAPVGKPNDTSAYELCFDSHGRLVETIDRSSGIAHFSSLVEQPSLATLRVPPERILHVFLARGVFARDGRIVGADERALPFRDDSGAFRFPRPPRP